MKFLTLLALVVCSLNTSHAQSLNRYDDDYVQQLKQKGRYYAEGELFLAGLLWKYAPASATLSDKFWAKLLPAEAAKLNDAIHAEKSFQTALIEARKLGKVVSADDKAGLDALKAQVAQLNTEMKNARSSKLESLGFFKRMGTRGYNLYKWGGRILVGFMLADGTFRLYHIITDKPINFDESAQVQQISEDQLRLLLR
jgi:hypothetical protein